MRPNPRAFAGIVELGSRYPMPAMAGFSRALGLKTMLSRAFEASRTIKGMTLSVCLAAGAMMGGCAGFDGVELQGGVFDAVGLTGSSQKKLSEVKVDARPGLVLPPTNDKLPDPVTGSIATAPQDGSWPVDPEDRRAANRAELEKRHKAFCERAIQEHRVRGETGVVMGPMGNCQPGLFGSLGKQLGGSE